MVSNAYNSEEGKAKQTQTPQNNFCNLLLKGLCAKDGTKKVLVSKACSNMESLQWLFNIFFFITNPTISVLPIFHTSFIVLNIIKARSRVND